MTPPPRSRPRLTNWHKTGRSHTLELLNGAIRATILVSTPPEHHTLFFLGRTISSPSLTYLHAQGRTSMRQTLLDAIFRLTPGPVPSSNDISNLLSYAKAHAADHSPGCPANDSCTCTYALRNHSVNICLNFLNNLLGEASNPSIAIHNSLTEEEDSQS